MNSMLTAAPSLAVEDEDMESIEKLLEKGADVNISPKKGTLFILYGQSCLDYDCPKTKQFCQIAIEPWCRY